MIEVSSRLTIGNEIKGRENGRAGRAECSEHSDIPAPAATSVYGKEPLLP
jgi:hypothetical protein